MLKLIIEDDEGRRTVVPFVRDEITIGRQEGNTIRLTERNVSRRHARLLRQTDLVYVEDLGSYNGIRVNGEKVVGRASINDGDLVQIGDYDLAIQAEGASQPVAAPLPPSETAQTLPAYPRSLVQQPGGEKPEEPETEASSPVYEDAEPLPDEEHTPVTASPSTAASSDVSRRQSTSVIRVDKVDTNRTRPLLELDPDEAPRLVVLNTEFAGREFACIRTELKIGRTDDNDICLDHRSLSRTHAKLVREAEGDWRILDLQSANGLTVNDESYAQATLKHLDVLELGHVRLKFVGAGESYAFVPGAEDKGSRKSGSKAPLLVGVALGALALGGGAWWYVQQQQHRAPNPVTAPSQAQASPRRAPSAASAGKSVAELANEKLAAARDAIGQNAFKPAVQELEALKRLEGVDAALLADAEDLLDQARAELLLETRLDDAAAALEKGQLAQARALLKDASSTTAWADRHKSLSEQLAAEQADVDRKRKKPTPVRTQKAPDENAPGRMRGSSSRTGRRCSRRSSTGKPAPCSPAASRWTPNSPAVT